MNSDFSTTSVSALLSNEHLHDLHKRDACIFKAERTLPCGSVVSERNGRIISKTSILPKA
ncbi:MAG: hypothetical protein PSY14_12980 [bacterium]|nr:hypothetical protein [bacterium]